MPLVAEHVLVFEKYLFLFVWLHQSFPGGISGEEFACNAGDLSLNSGLGRSPGGGHGNPRQYSCGEFHGQRSLARPWQRVRQD